MKISRLLHSLLPLTMVALGSPRYNECSHFGGCCFCRKLSVYGCSRSLASLAVQGLLPKCVGYVDRAGRPLVAIMITNAFGLLGFLAAELRAPGYSFHMVLSICSLAVLLHGPQSVSLTSDTDGL